jgi:hypothetical protein
MRVRVPNLAKRDGLVTEEIEDCGECGAVVFSSTRHKHKQWHVNQDAKWQEVYSRLA